MKGKGEMETWYLDAVTLSPSKRTPPGELKRFPVGASKRSSGRRATDVRVARPTRPGLG